MSTKRDRNVADLKELTGYENVAEVASGFADPVRLEIIEALAQSARTVDSLAQVCGLPMKNVSHHLQRLRAVGLVDRVKLGRRSVYSLKDERVALLWAAFHQFSKGRVSGPDETDIGLGDSSLAAGSLLELVAGNRVVVIDVRPAEEFESGHLPGALSIPMAELEGRLESLPRGKPVVAFCRGPYCRLADRAVDLLRHAGFEALRCADGIMEWRAAGQPLERAAEE